MTHLLYASPLIHYRQQTHYKLNPNDILYNLLLSPFLAPLSEDEKIYTEFNQRMQALENLVDEYPHEIYLKIEFIQYTDNSQEPILTSRIVGDNLNLKNKNIAVDNLVFTDAKTCAKYLIEMVGTLYQLFVTSPAWLEYEEKKLFKQKLEHELSIQYNQHITYRTTKI